MRLSERLGALIEGQKTDAALSFTGDEPQVRKGAFKVSAVAMRWLDQEAPPSWRHPDGTADYTKQLFSVERNLMRAIPREDLPALLGIEGEKSPNAAMVAAQDFLAAQPRKAFQLFLRKVGTKAPKVAAMFRKKPEFIPVYWYIVMTSISGRDMADTLLKRYFSTEQWGKAFGQARKKFEAVEDEEDGEDEGEAMDDEGMCPVTGEPRPCEARDHTDGAACEACEGPEDDDEEMDAEEASEAVGHWVAALMEAAAKKKKASKQQQLSAKYLNPKTGGFKGRKGEKFGNCVKYMKAKGGVSDPKALCGTIARKKAGALGEAREGKGAKATRLRALEMAGLLADLMKGQGYDVAYSKLGDEWVVFQHYSKFGFVTLWKNPRGDWQLISGVPEMAKLNRATPRWWPADQRADMADPKYQGNKEALGVATQAAEKIMTKTRAGTLTRDFAPEAPAAVRGRKERMDPGGAAAMGEAVGWALMESEEVDPRKMIEHGDAMLKIVEGLVDDLRKGVVAAQADLKGYARVGVPGRGASALLKKHLLFPAERMEDMAKKVRETIEKGIRVFG